MNLLQKTERLLKQNWKERKRITLAVIVSFLINGGVGYATEGLEYTSFEKSSNVDIQPKDPNITVYNDSLNHGTIVDINKPNERGISHNEYNVFNMTDSNSQVLFNNSGMDGHISGRESALGFRNVSKNHNFAEGDKATLIITEITGGEATTLEGKLEVRSKDSNGIEPYGVDLIFANENGINVNGIRYFDVDNVMYVNDRDWANQDRINKEKQKAKDDKVELFTDGSNKGSEGIIHKGKEKNDTYYQGQKLGWKIPEGGIHKNELKQKLEEEKRKLEKERERLEKERREQLEREEKERERLEKERREQLEREEKERERLEKERREQLEREEKERERLEKERQEQLERKEKEREKQEDEKKIKELEEKIETIEKRLEEVKEKIEVEESSQGGNHPKNDTPAPIALLSSDTSNSSAVSYISTYGLGSMHGNQILMRADDSGFYGVQYSSEQKKNAISIDKQTGEIDVKDLSSSVLTPRSVKLTATSGNEFEKIPEEDIEGNTPVIPAVYKALEKTEDGYNLEEEEVTEEDVTEADINKVNKNITMDGYQPNGLVPRTFRSGSSSSTEYEEIPQDVLEEAERGEESAVPVIHPAALTSSTSAPITLVASPAESPKVLAQTVSTEESSEPIGIKSASGPTPVFVPAALTAPAVAAPLTLEPSTMPIPASLEAVPVSSSTSGSESTPASIISGSSTTTAVPGPVALTAAPTSETLSANLAEVPTPVLELAVKSAPIALTTSEKTPVSIQGAKKVTTPVPAAMSSSAPTVAIENSSLKTVFTPATEASSMALKAAVPAAMTSITPAAITGTPVITPVSQPATTVSAPLALTATSEEPSVDIQGQPKVEQTVLDQAVPVSGTIEIAAAPNTISAETLKEAVKVPEAKEEALKRLNHIEVKDPSKTQLEKVDGHDKSTLVQIAEANSNGISHNEYNQFSIEQDENVLLNNNSSDSDVSSKLLDGKTFAGNKNLRGKSASLIINEVGLNNQGATKLAGGLEVLGTRSDVIIANENGVIVNGGRFENVGDLTLSTGKYKEGTSKDDFQFEERKGKIDVIGKSDIQNNLNIYSQDFNVNADLSAQSLKVDASGQTLVKDATVLAEDVIDINTKTLKNSNAKIQSKNAIKIKGEDIFNEENSKISADILLIDGKKVENSGEIEAANKLGIHATEDIINRRVIAGNILDLKAGKSFKNINAALLYAQEKLQVDANEISNIGSSILSNGSLFLRGENAITNEKGGMIQSKDDGRLIGRKITNNASSISSLAKLYLKTDELLNIGEFSSSLKVTDQVRNLYKHVDVRESYWKAWYNGYNITVSIPRAKKELRVKQASIDAGDDLVISKYKKDKTQVYNRDSSITARGNIYVEGSVDNLTTTSASTLEGMLKRIKVKLAWNTSSLVDRSQLSSGVEADGASLYDLLKEKDKLKRYQYFNLLKGLNDPELDRILNQALGEDWKAKDDIPDLKLGGTIEYYSADNRARIDSTKNIFVEGDIENSSIVENVSLEQWKKEKPKIDQEARRIEDALFNMKVTMVGDSTITGENTSVDGIYSRQVSVLALLREKDPKKRKEYFEQLKDINDPKLNEVLASTLGKDWKSKKEVPVIKEGYVGKKKKENTIYQMILEDGDERPIDDLYQLNNNDVKLRNVLQTQNGKYEKLKDNKEFLFKTSDVIKDKVEYKGYDYLVEGLKSKGKNTSNAKLIGDSQYQYDMISNLWKSYDQKAPDKEYIEERFKDSLEEANRLNLEIGKPLTEEQQKELNRSIIWYVEKEIEGEKVLTPVMYFPEDKLYTLSRIREDKAISKIGAWGSIFAESDNVTNENSTINAVKNVKIKTNVLVNRGSKEFDSDIYAGEDLDIEAKKVLSEFAALKATGDIDVTARNIDVTASDIVSKSNVKLRAENIDVKDAVLKSSTKEINSEVVGKAGHVMEEVATSTETSRASNIQGENVYVKADENLNVTGSNIKAEDEAKLEGNKVNLAASMTTNTRKTHSESQATGIDDLFGAHSDSRSKETKANATEVTGKNVEVNAGENLTVDGSKVKAKKNVWLESQGTLDVKNVQEETHVATNSSSVGILGINLGAKTLDQTKNSHSSLTAGSHLRARAAKDVNVRSSDITAKDAEIISRERDVNFTADKEESKTTSTNVSLGVTGSAGAGIGGVGATAEFDSANKTASGEVINNYVNKRQKGERIPTLASGDLGLKMSFNHKQKEEVTWDKGKISTEGLLDVEARKGHMELGGTDVESGSDASAVARRIDAKTYTNSSTEKTTGVDFTLKQSVGASSSVVDAINAGHEIARDASNKELNAGLAAAKAVGAVTNLVFNDTVGVNSRQSIGGTFRNSTLKVEEDTRSSITAKGRLSLQATESDVDLKNVDLKGKRVILDAERDVKVSAGKRTETKDGISVSGEVRQQQTAGVSAAFGANTQLGVGGSADFEKEHSERTEYRNSSIEGEQVYVRSKRDTKIDGANVRGEEATKLKVGRNLEVTSKEDSYSEDKIKANAGVTVSAGVGSTTIGAGNVNASGGGGRFTASGTKIGQRTSVTSGGVLDVEVEGDTLLSSATLASDVRKGQLAVGGELKVNDVETSETAGGASVGLSGGVTGELGLDLELGDKKDKLVQEKSVIGLRRENIKAKKITKNSKEVKVDDLETDVSYERNIVRDVEEKGGSASLSFSVKDTKTIAKGVKNKIKNIRANRTSSRINTGDSYSGTRRVDNTDPIYSRLQDSSNPSDPLKRALPETPVERNRREIEANPSSRVTAEDLKRIPEGVRSQEGMVENTLYRSAGDATYSRANSGDTEGMKNNPIYEGTTASPAYSTVGKALGDDGYFKVGKVENTDPIYSKVQDSSNPSDPLKRALPETPVEKNRREIEANPSSRVTAEDLKRIPEGVRSQEGMVDNVLYKSIEDTVSPRVNSGDAEGMKDNPIYEGSASSSTYSTVGKASGDAETVYTLRTGETSVIGPRALRSSGEGDSGYETIPGVYKNGVESPYSLRAPEGMYSELGAGARRNPSTDPLPATPRQSLEAQTQGNRISDGVYDVIKDPSTIKEGWRENDIYESTPIDMQKNPLYSEGLKRDPKRDALPEVPASSSKRVNGETDAVYERVAETVNSNDGTSRFKAENSDDLYTKIDPKTKKKVKMSEEEIKKKKAEELTKKLGPKKTVHVDEGEYATVKRTGATGEITEGVLTPRASRGQNAGEEFERIPDSGSGSKSRRRRSTAEDGEDTSTRRPESLYATVEGTEGVRPRSKNEGSGDYEKLPDDVLKFGTEDPYSFISEPDASSATNKKSDIQSRRLPEVPNKVEEASRQRPESLYATVEGAEGIQPRSNRRDSGDYETLPDHILKNGTPDEGPVMVERTGLGKRRSVEAENVDSTTSPIKPGNMEAPALPPRNAKGDDQVHIDELGRVVVPESQLDTISLGENTYHQQLENKLRSEAFDKLTMTDTSVSNTDYIPKKLTEQERDAFFDKIRKKAEKRDPHKETMDKIKKIAQDPNDIPKEHVLKKLEDFTYGYNNEDVLKLVTRSAEDGSKIIVPDTLDKSKIKEGRKDLGDIFLKLQFDPQYDNARKEIDNKIYETLSKNPEFKKIMNQELAGNKEGIQKLFDQVVEAKKSAFKEVVGVDIETPKLVLKDEIDKKGHTHGYYLDDVVNMNTVPPTDKGRADKRENNKDLLNTIIHELTHHDQSYLAQNKDNPALRKDLQTDARLFGINQDLYVNVDGHYKDYKSYRNQPLERDAFNAGDGLSDRLMQKVYDEPVSNAKGMGNTKYSPKELTAKQKAKIEKKLKKANKQKNSEFTDSYNNFRNGVDQKIMDNLSADPQFKKLINSDLSGDSEKVKELIGVVARAKKNSLEAMGETNIPKTELQLKEAVAISSNGRNRDEQNADILNNILKQYTYRAGEEAGTALVKKVNAEKAEELADGIGNTKYVPKKVDAAEIEKLSKQAKEKYENRDSEKEALNKLKTIAQVAGELPKEHLVKALTEMTKGRKIEETAALYKKAKESGVKNIVRPDTIGEFSGETAKAMGQLYRKVQFEDSYVKTREEINKKTVEKLDSNKEFHDLMKTKLSGNTEGLRKLYDIVATAKTEALKEVTGVDAPKPELQVNEGKKGNFNPLQGIYHNDVVKMNNVPLLSFAKTKKQNNKKLLDTIVHELTHYDQDALTRSTKNPNVPEALRPDIDLMNHNFKYYIKSRDDYFTYRKQPLETEAFFSGHKLGEELSKIVDRGYRGDVGENGKLREIKEIEHLPNKVNNLESPKEAQTDLGNNALIYGLKNGREELIHRANDADKQKKNAILADSYIGDLNLGFEFSRLSDFAGKVNAGKVTDADIDAIANYKDLGAENALASSSRSRINAANTEDNKKIITELLKNETAVNALKKMDDLNQQERKLLTEVKKIENVDVDNPQKSNQNTEAENKLIDEYNSVKEKINETRVDFFAEKTKLIAKETLDRGGKVYFSLDGLATDTMKYDKNKTNVDFDKLKDLFDPKNPYYDAVTSKELRYLYENYKDNPNLKFTVKDHVIENPLKTLKVEDVEASSTGEKNSIVMEKNLFPNPFKSKSKDQGPVIKHLGGEETTSHYFPLDKIVTKNADVSKDMKVNLDNIKKAFTPGDKHYNDSEAKSLREMYKKDPSMEQTKFIIGNQVIENPFKNPELQGYIKSQQGKELPPVPAPRTRRGVAEESSQNRKGLRSQENGVVSDGYYVDRVVKQASKTPSTGDPVYADLQFGKSNKQALQTQENGAPGSYYANRVVNQTSQASSTGEPLYADLQFGRVNSRTVQDGHLESDYAEIGRKNKRVSEDSIYENLDQLRALEKRKNPVVMEKNLFSNPFKGKAKKKGTETLSEAEKKALFDNAKKQAKERDTAKEAERKLKLLAENADNIPKEHMLKAVKELAYGLSIEDATALRKKAAELGKKIHRPDMIEGFEGKNVKNMGEILKKIQFDPEYVKTREEINQKIVEKLDSNKEFHDLMKTKLSGNEEGIKKLFKMVESAKHDSLKEVTGIDGKRAEVVLNTERGPLSMKQGHYSDNEVNMNAVPLLSFLRSKKQNNKEILDTIVHELTHHDQAQITRNKDRNLPEHMRQDAELMALNETYYINSDLNTFSAYKKQPLEREAFISGHKLGEQLSKLVDKGYTGDIGENGKLREIKEIEHLPNKINNLESPKEAQTDLGNNSLIYGLKYGRQELIDKANEADPNRKNATLADSYIGKLNLGYEFGELTNFAKKLNKGEVTEADIKEIAEFKDPGAEHARKTDSRSRINAANNEDNQKIMQELLKNETAVNSLKKVGALSEKIEDVFSKMRKNEYLDLDNPKESPSFTEEQNKQIREFKALENEINNARMDFFAEKTKLIAKETLERGGKLYFALDGLATDSPTYTKNTNVDFDKLKDLFDPNNPYYDAVTSRELRYLYENYKDNPNLKFTIKDHVVENPLKTLKMEEVEASAERNKDTVTMEKSLFPKLFRSKAKEKGPVIKHLGGEDTTSHYFPLDKIVTKNADISKDMKVNLENIKKAFTPEDKHYNDSESKSLREMYKKDPTMEQTKFIIGNQVIENPFKNPELQEYIKSQQGKEPPVTNKAKKALPPAPTSRVKRAADEVSQNQRTLRSQENSVPGAYYVNKVLNQTSQTPSTGEPVYADLQFVKPNSKIVRDGQVESEYAEVGRREEFLEAPTRALPPIPKETGKSPVKPKVPRKPSKQVLQTQKNGIVVPGSYYASKIVNQTSQTPSTGEPVYADLQFVKPNSKTIRDGQVESEYAEVGRKNKTVSEEPTYENVNQLRKPAVPPKRMKIMASPKK